MARFEFGSRVQDQKIEGLRQFVLDAWMEMTANSEFAIDRSEYWENDRVNARRPFVAVPLFSKIDRLLQKHLPDQFAKIQLAPGRW
jgi:hypothetical protein